MHKRTVKSHLRRILYLISRYYSGFSALCLTGVRHFNVPSLDQYDGVLLASNHQSFLDPVLIGMPLEEPIRYLARKTLFEKPIFGPLISAVGAMPVRRGNVDGSALRAALKTLREGLPLLLFPEGTRTTTGEIGHMREGAAMMAARCNVPVIPVCVEGAYRAWPRSQTFPHPAFATVIYGDPIEPGAQSGEELNREIENTIREMQVFARSFVQS